MDASYDDLVERLDQVDGKHDTISALRAGGEDAKPALLRGLQHPAWRVRPGCLRELDHTIVDDPTRRAVLQGLDDPHRKVRRAALHVLGCEVCKPEGYCGIEGVDLEATYLDTAVNDRSGRVQSSALAHFMWRSTLDEAVVDGMHAVLASDANHEVRRRAAAVLAFPHIAAMPKSRERRERYAAMIDELLAESRTAAR